MEFEVGHSDTAGDERQQTTEGIAGAGANRPLNIGLHIGHHGAARVVSGEACGGKAEPLVLEQIRIVDRAFDADHPIVDLVIIADMAAEDYALRVAD